MKADRLDGSGPTSVNSHPLIMSNPPGISRAPLHPSHAIHTHHPGQNSSKNSGTNSVAGSNHQGSPLQRQPSTIQNHQQGVRLFDALKFLLLKYRFACVKNYSL